jgi:chromosome segregation ATPase
MKDRAESELPEPIARSKSIELCQQLAKHSELCHNIAEGMNLTVEEKKDLPQFMLRVLDDVITRALTMDEKLREDERKWQEVQCQVEEAIASKQSASTRLLDEVSQLGKQVKTNTLGVDKLLKELAQRSKELEEAKAEIGNIQSPCGPLLTLESTVLSLQKELGCTRDEMQSCKQELAMLKDASPLGTNRDSCVATDSDVMVASDNKDVGVQFSMMPACFTRKLQKDARR